MTKRTQTQTATETPKQKRIIIRDKTIGKGKAYKSAKVDSKKKPGLFAAEDSAEARRAETLAAWQQLVAEGMSEADAAAKVGETRILLRTWQKKQADARLAAEGKKASARLAKTRARLSAKEKAKLEKVAGDQHRDETGRCCARCGCSIAVDGPIYCPTCEPIMEKKPSRLDLDGKIKRAAKATKEARAKRAARAKAAPVSKLDLDGKVSASDPRWEQTGLGAEQIEKVVRWWNLRCEGSSSQQAVEAMGSISLGSLQVYWRKAKAVGLCLALPGQAPASPTEYSTEGRGMKKGARKQGAQKKAAAPKGKEREKKLFCEACLTMKTKVRKHRESGLWYCPDCMKKEKALDASVAEPHRPSFYMPEAWARLSRNAKRNVLKLCQGDEEAQEAARRLAFEDNLAVTEEQDPGVDEPADEPALGDTDLHRAAFDNLVDRLTERLLTQATEQAERLAREFGLDRDAARDMLRQSYRQAVRARLRTSSSAS